MFIIPNMIQLVLTISSTPITWIIIILTSNYVLNTYLNICNWIFKYLTHFFWNIIYSLSLVYNDNGMTTILLLIGLDYDIITTTIYTGTTFHLGLQLFRFRLLQSCQILTFLGEGFSNWTYFPGLQFFLQTCTVLNSSYLWVHVQYWVRNYFPSFSLGHIFVRQTRVSLLLPLWVECAHTRLVVLCWVCEV